MPSVAGKLQLAGALWLLGHSVGACGGLDGARYTVLGTTELADDSTPADDMVLTVISRWTLEGSISFSPGGNEHDGIPIATTTVAVGPWTPTASASEYQFAVDAEVPVPEDGDEPRSVVLRIDSPTDGLSAYSENLQDVPGEAEDGIVPIDVTANFVFSSP